MDTNNLMCLFLSLSACIVITYAQCGTKASGYSAGVNCGGGGGGAGGAVIGAGGGGGTRSSWSSSSKWRSAPSSSYSSWSSSWSRPSQSYTYYSQPSGVRNRWWRESSYSAPSTRYYVDNVDVGKGAVGGGRVVERVVERPVVRTVVEHRPVTRVQRPVQRVIRPAERTETRVEQRPGRMVTRRHQRVTNNNNRRVVERPAVTRVTCSDNVSQNHDLVIRPGQVVSSCSEIVRQFPSVCNVEGVRGGRCCQSCASVGTPNCLDQLSEANAITFSNDRSITSCPMLVTNYQALCNTYGGPGGLCCHSCQPILEEFARQRAQKGGTNQVVVRETTNERGQVIVRETYQEKGDTAATVVNVQNEKAAPATGNRVAATRTVTCVDRIRGQMQSKGPGYTCEQYINLDPCNCQDVAEDCCESCANINLNEVDCRCRNTLSRAYPYYVYVPVTDAQGERKTEMQAIESCDDLVKRYPQFCNQIGGAGQSCCKACRAPERQTSKCEDQLSSEFAITLTTGGRIEDCRILARDYKEFCIQYGGENGLCCKSCQNVDTSCVDSALSWWYVDGKKLNCRQYITRNPCMCQVISDQCCESCKNVDTSRCGCRDSLSARRPYMVELYTEKGKSPIRRRVTSCTRIVRQYPEQCQRLGLKTGSCCHSCNRLGLTCTDMLSTEEPLILENGDHITSCQSLANEYQDMCFDYGRPGGLCCNACHEFLEEYDNNVNNQHTNVEVIHENVVTEKPHVAVVTQKPETNVIIRGHAERGDNLHELSGPEEEFYVFKTPMEETLDMDMDKAISERQEVHGGNTIRIQSPESHSNTIVTEERTQVRYDVDEQSNVIKGPAEAVVTHEVVDNKGPAPYQPSYNTEEVYYAKGPDSKSVYQAVRHRRPVYFHEREAETRTGCVDRELGKMQSKGPGLTCRDYITRDFCNCEEVGHECCASCANVNLDVDQCKCRDLLTKFYPFYVYPNGIDSDEGKETITNCWDLVTRYPQFCAQIGAPGQSCCRACRQADIQHDCMDQLSDKNFLEYIPQGRITDCRILRRDYTSLCAEHGGRNGVCCHSCQNVDLTCVDDALMYWEVDGANLNCRQYVHQNPCVCMTVKNSCCASCQNIDLNRCKCRDYLSARQPYIVTLYDGAQPREETVTDCDTIGRYYQQFCSNLGGEGQACCRTCRHIATMSLTKG